MFYLHETFGFSIYTSLATWLSIQKNHTTEFTAHPTNPEEESLILQKIYTFVP